MTIHPYLLAFEIFVFAMPTAVFLSRTLPEVLRLTRDMFYLRASSNPEISYLQASSALLLWACGAFAFGVLIWLAVATIRQRVFRFGLFFWLGLSAGLYCVARMFAPFGDLLTVAIALPLLLLATHCVVLQAKQRFAASGPWPTRRC